MKTWDKFLKDVLPWTPGCPEPTAEHAVRRAAQEYLQATRAWRMWLPAVKVKAGRLQYDLDMEPRSELVRLERATLDGCPICIRTEDELPADWMSCPGGLETGVHTPEGKTVFLLPRQEADKVLLVEVSLQPSSDALGVEDFIFERYAAQIAVGAVAALKGHTEKSYSDATGAVTWRGQFDGHLCVADFQRYRGHSSARPRRRIQTF